MSERWLIKFAKNLWKHLSYECSKEWILFIFNKTKNKTHARVQSSYWNKVWNGVEDRHGKLYSCEHVVTYVRTICLLAASVTKTCIEYHEGKLIASELDTCRWKSRPKNSRSPPKSRPMVNPLKNQQIQKTQQPELDRSTKTLWMSPADFKTKTRKRVWP